MILSDEERYWHYFMISENFRKANVGSSLSVVDIYGLIPFDVICASVRYDDDTHIIDWVMEEHLGYRYDDEKEKWIKD